jgi:hypothetical protein
LKLIKIFYFQEPSSHILNQEVFKSFYSLLTLFNDAEQTEIDYQSKSGFLFLTDQFYNSFHENVCLKVSIDSSQSFF